MEALLKRDAISLNYFSLTRREVLKPHLEGVAASYSLMDWTPKLSGPDLSAVQGLCVLRQATKRNSTLPG